MKAVFPYQQDVSDRWSVNNLHAQILPSMVATNPASQMHNRLSDIAGKADYANQNVAKHPWQVFKRKVSS